MGGGGGGQNTVERQNTEPWAAARPHLVKLYQQAESLADRPLTMYTPPPLSGGAMQALRALSTPQALPSYDRNAGAASLGGARTAIGQLAGIGGGLEQYEARLRGLGDSTSSGDADAIRSMTATGVLADTHSGKFLTPDSNPYLKRYYDQAASDINRQYGNATVPNLGSSFNRAGGLTGSMHALYQGEANRGLSDALGRTATNIYGSAYENERNRQMAAGTEIAGLFERAGQMDMASRQQRAGLYQGAASLRQQRFNDAATEAGAWGQLSDTEAAREQQRYANELDRIQRQNQQYQQVLGVEDYLRNDQAQRDPANIEMQWQQAEWDRLQTLARLINGGGQSSTATQERPASRASLGSTALGAAGGAATAAGLYSGLMSTGLVNSWNPYGWAALAGGALLGGLSSRM